VLKANINNQKDLNVYMTNSVRISKHNTLQIKINTDSRDYILGMRELFTQYVEGFQFTPKFKSGSWNGKICLINGLHNTLPYGLLIDLIKFHKTHFPSYHLSVDDDVKEFFKGPKLKIKYDLTLKPRFYQKESINICLKHTKGIIRSATASGKSVVISYIIKTLLENKKSGVKRVLLFVPTVSLVEQFYSDMIEYGMDKNLIGRVYTKRKEWDMPITISTWQSLMNNHDKIPNYDCIISDEVHQAKSHELKRILVKAVNANYRLGFTGTLHSSELDNWNVKSYLGPVLKEYSSGFLAEKGFISKCNVHILGVGYNDENIEGTYDEVKDIVFTNDYRISTIRSLVDNLDHNVLVLVGKVEKEGDFLVKELEGINKEVVFLSGRDSVEEREKWRSEMVNRKDIVLIATYGIFAQGINIPNLKYTVLAAPFKSKIRVLQSIGRNLRMHENKKHGAHIFDIHDRVKYLEKHGDVRYRFYDGEKFAINEYDLTEGNEFDFSSLIFNPQHI